MSLSRRSPDPCYGDGACENFGIELFDADDLHPLNVRFEGLSMPAAEVMFSPSGELLAAVPPFVFADPFDNIAVWDVDEPAEPVTRLSLRQLGVNRFESLDSIGPAWLDFSPDGTRVYAGAAGPTVVFDLSSGESIRSFDGEGALALSPDGRSIAILSGPTTVGVFDTTDGQRQAELVGHDALVTAAAFSPDGRRLATVSNDESVAVWDVATGQRVHLLEGHVGSVLGVDFGVDGTTLYTSAADGSIIIWDIEGAGGVARRLQRTKAACQLRPIGVDQPHRQRRRRAGGGRGHQVGAVARQPRWWRSHRVERARLGRPGLEWLQPRW